MLDIKKFRNEKLVYLNICSFYALENLIKGASCII